jgi:hypothetical protein
MKTPITLLLNLCLGLFLADAILSLVDDSLILLFGLHLISVVRGLLAFFALLMVILVYGLMGLTPLIPKRLFLPLAMFYLLAMLAVFPFSIYYYGRIQQLAWILSLCQVILGLGLLRWLLGGFKFRWPLVEEKHLGTRRFSWANLSVFALANVFVLLPAIVVYFALCASVAVDHFSDGFIALRRDGLIVRVREYARDDGRKVRLIPMAHVGEADFYRKISQSFPTNSIILMEGVTDDRNLLTNKPSYKRMATSLGLAEQEEKFEPTQGEMVHADVDVAQFSTNTIGFLNLVMLIHVRGVSIQTLLPLIQYSPPPHIEQQILEDILGKRNRRVADEIQARLLESENIMVPWGAAHMPGIAKEIQKSGFRLVESREYQVIRFRSARK